MMAHDALIAWSPLDAELPTRGQIKVGEVAMDGHDWTAPYAFTFPADEAHQALRGDASIKAVFVDFHYLVVEERLDPEVVHRAFLAIDEYATLFGVLVESHADRT